MKLEINGEVYQVPREYELAVYDQLMNKEALPWYARLEDVWKIGAMVISRGVLAFIERKIYLETGDKEKARSIRPPDKKTDVNIHTAKLLAGILLEGLNHVIVSCQTGVDAETGAQRVTAFNLQIEAEPNGAAFPVAQDSGEAR